MFGHNGTMFMSWLAMIVIWVLPFIVLLTGLKYLGTEVRKGPSRRRGGR